MAEVFMSYARPDGPAAAVLADDVTQAGIDVWCGSETPVGDNWNDQINRHLENAEAVISCFFRLLVSALRMGISRVGFRAVP